MSSFFHLCFVVQDIERATRDLTRTTGLTWSPVRHSQLGDWEYDIVFSSEGPPFVEVINGPPGSPWDATSGSRFDHIGYWSADLNADKQGLAERGARMDFDACPYGRSFSYHHLDSIGARIELVDIAGQAAFLNAWSPGGSPMAALDIDSPGRP